MIINEYYLCKDNTYIIINYNNNFCWNFLLLQWNILPITFRAKYWWISLIKKLLKICQLENFKLKKTDIQSLLLVYDFSKISKAIVTATSTNTDIKNPKGYLVSILNDMDKIKTTTVNVNKSGKGKDIKFNSDIHQREYNYDDLEKKLLGWDND